jgi:hypothetical protein
LPKPNTESGVLLVGGDVWNIQLFGKKVDIVMIGCIVAYAIDEVNRFTNLKSRTVKRRFGLTLTAGLQKY